MKTSQQLVTAQRPLHCNSLLGLSDRKGKKNARSFFPLCPQKPGAVFARVWNTFSTFEGWGGGSNVKSFPLGPGTAVLSGKTRKAGTELGKGP